MKTGTIKIAHREKGFVKVKATILDNFATHKRTFDDDRKVKNNEYIITHIDTGMNMHSIFVGTKKQCIEIINRINKIENINDRINDYMKRVEQKEHGILGKASILNEIYDIVYEFKVALSVANF